MIGSMSILAMLLGIPAAFVVTLILEKFGHVPGGKGPRALSTLIGSVAFALLFAAIGYGSIALQTSDTEILSGEVTGKKREHGHYEKRHENCTTDSNGKKHCTVWYEDRYTVKWSIFTTLNNITVDSLDSGSRLVYSTPDPSLFTSAYVGEPAAMKAGYTNYMKGIPKQFLYNEHLGASPELIAKIPNYPQIYNLYQVNRVLDLDGVLGAGQSDRLNAQIATKLKSTGPAKEVNLVLMFGKWDDNVQYAIREKWDGGKKNDVIVYIGTGEDGRIVETRVQTWSSNELFSIRLQDKLIEHAVIDDMMLNVIFSQIMSGYERPRMRDYEHLRIHISPSNGAITFMFSLLFLLPLAVFLILNYQTTPTYRRFR